MPEESRGTGDRRGVATLPMVIAVPPYLTYHYGSNLHPFPEVLFYPFSAVVFVRLHVLDKINQSHSSFILWPARLRPLYVRHLWLAETIRGLDAGVPRIIRGVSFAASNGLVLKTAKHPSLNVHHVALWRFLTLHRNGQPITSRNGATCEWDNVRPPPHPRALHQNKSHLSKRWQGMIGSLCKVFNCVTDCMIPGQQR